MYVGVKIPSKKFVSLSDSIYWTGKQTNKQKELLTNKQNWKKNKKEGTTNTINKKDKCLQYAITVALNQEKILKNPERITQIKVFVTKYKFEGINYTSEKDDWKKYWNEKA